jgi:hypothetical protein
MADLKKKIRGQKYGKEIKLTTSQETKIGAILAKVAFLSL